MNVLELELGLQIENYAQMLIATLIAILMQFLLPLALIR